MNYHPSTYNRLSAEIRDKPYLVDIYAHTAWMRDPHSADIVLIEREVFERIRVKPSGATVVYIPANQLENDWWISNILKHFRIGNASQYAQRT